MGLIEQYISLVGGVIAIVTFILTTLRYIDRKKMKLQKFLSQGFTVQNYNDLRFYIKPTIKKITNRKYIFRENNILNEIVNNNNKKYIFITGVSGVGKSLFFAYLAKFYYKLIYLPQKLLYRKHEIQNAKNLPNKNGTLLLIDSVDESTNLDLSNLIKNQLSKLNEFGKIIVAVRKLDIENEKVLIDSSDVDLYQIIPFENLKIFLYLLKRFKLNILQLINSYITINKDRELFSIPFFLSFVGKISLKNVHNINKNEVYKRIISSALGLNKLSINFSILEILFENITLEMYKTKKSYISVASYYKIVDSLKINIKPQFLKIIYINVENVEFVHYTFFEYFLSKKMIRNPDLFIDKPNFLESNKNILEFINGEKTNFFRTINGRYELNNNQFHSYSFNSSFEIIQLDNISQILIRVPNDDFYKLNLLDKISRLSTIFLIHNIYSVYLFKLVFYIYSDSKISQSILKSMNKNCLNYLDNIVKNVPKTIEAIKTYGNLNMLGVIEKIDAYFIAQINQIIKKNELVKIEKQYGKIKSITINKFEITEREIQKASFFINEIINIQGKLEKSYKIIII